MNNPFQFKKGELKQRARKQEMINDMILLGASEDKEWSNIEVVTLKQYMRDQAIDWMWENKWPTNLHDTDDIITSLIKERYNSSYEFVKVLEDRILVGVDCSDINDKAVDKALLMLVEMPSFEVGTYVTFGEKVTLYDA